MRACVRHLADCLMSGLQHNAAAWPQNRTDLRAAAKFMANVSTVGLSKPLSLSLINQARPV